MKYLQDLSCKFNQNNFEIIHRAQHDTQQYTLSIFFCVAQSCIILLLMEGKYHTIDPIILETLNLNERRMNHILDIIHGRQPKDYGKTERRSINRSRPNSLNNRSHTINHTISHDEFILPPIKHTARPRQRQSKKSERVPQASPITERRSRTIERSRKSLSREVSSSKGKKQKRQKVQEQPVNIEEQVRQAQQQKRKQLMQDYMYTKLKRSKSMEVNPKDLYRIQIEHMVSEPTPIQQMEDAQRKMQRLKKRCKHLFTFDKAYYSRLNQAELLNLS